eukprot:COSAG05_NODE_925_length_6575_cov_68.709320_3_plen_77_part_00
MQPAAAMLYRYRTRSYYEKGSLAVLPVVRLYRYRYRTLADSTSDFSDSTVETDRALLYSRTGRDPYLLLVGLVQLY